MTVLVTGGAGFIGSHTLIELVNAHEELVVVDNFSNSCIESLKRVEGITGKKITFYELDILDSDALREVFNTHEIRSVIHFAGLKAVGESVEKPLMYYHINIMGTLSLVEVMKEHDVKKMVFSSSATVYGVSNQSPLTEDMPLSAINPYGQTKLMIEQILKDLCVSDPEWSVVLLRYFNPIGAHESGLIGENPLGKPNNLMPYITQVAVGKQEELKIFGDDYNTIDGTGVRDYIHVVDLAKGHVKALQFADNNQGAEAINLGTGNGYSVLELVNTFKTCNHVDVPYRISTRRAGDIATCYANPQKAETLLAWSAEYDLERMCMDSWRWQKQNPLGYTKNK